MKTTRQLMRVKYFSDTDTALIEFTTKEIVETRELNENIYVDLDENGNIVSMTVEHAKADTDYGNFLIRKCRFGLRRLVDKRIFFEVRVKLPVFLWRW